MNARIFKKYGLAAILAGVALSVSLANASDLKVSVAREGKAIRIDVPPAADNTLILETKKFLNESSDWNPVLRLNPPHGRRSYYDPLCRVEPIRFYRLREANDGGLPWADNFSLIDVDGIARELYYHTHVPVIVLLTVGESLAVLRPILPEIQALRNEYGENALFWAILSQPKVNRKTLAAEAASLGADFPILLDSSRVVTRNLRPRTFPEAFAVRSADWTLFYQGTVITEVDTGLETRSNAYLRNALAQYFANDSISVELAEGAGESANLPNLGTISYAADIAPIFVEHCVRCHSEGNIAPFALDSYDAVLENAFAIKQQVMSGKMPPWHADDYYGRFANETRLTPTQKELLIEWINRGAARGEGEDPLASVAFSAPTDWLLGEPDYIVEIPEQEVPAEGVVDYLYITVPNPVPRDAWLKAAVVIPGNAEVVHHSLVFMTTTLEDLFAIQGGLAGFYTGYVPGLDPAFFPEGTGKFLPKGATFVFQQHYTPNGKAATDVTKLGLYLADGKPDMQLVTASAFSIDIDIPENERNHQITASRRIHQDSWLVEMNPHMHYRGKRFQYEAFYPDGSSEILLSTPDYHFDWQRMYRLAEPKFLPQGTQIRISGSFDNSQQNRRNPDPNQRVRFGQQSWDEMFIGYFNYAVAQ